MIFAPFSAIDSFFNSRDRIHRFQKNVSNCTPQVKISIGESCKHWRKCYFVHIQSLYLVVKIRFQMTVEKTKPE